MAKTTTDKVTAAKARYEAAEAAHAEAVNRAYPTIESFLNSITGKVTTPAIITDAYNNLIAARGELQVAQYEAEGARQGFQILGRTDKRFIDTLAQRGYYGESAYHTAL